MDSVKQVPKCLGKPHTLARCGDNDEEVIKDVVDSVLEVVASEKNEGIS